MLSATTVRAQLESALAHRIPSALSPPPRAFRPVVSTGISAVDDLLRGGLPVGAITEIIGPESSGRTSLSLSFVAQITQKGRVCAWVDVTSALHPESAAAAGVDLSRLLWVRCGVAAQEPGHMVRESGFTIPKSYLTPPPIKKGLHGGGCGGHPRMESKGMSDAIGGFLRPHVVGARCAEPQRRLSVEKQSVEPISPLRATDAKLPMAKSKPWSRIEQALKVTDLLLQAGGFSSIVLDMGGLAPEVVARVPLATWFRYRAAAERSQVSFLLLTQHACAKSSAELVLRLEAGATLGDEATVFSGLDYRVNVTRERFNGTNVVPLRKGPQRESGAAWRTRTVWAESR